MGTHEEPLRQRFCRGIDCGRVFWICRHCYRGHKYCSLRCRQKTRGQQTWAANRKHQKSPEGRDDHRDRNRAYRARRRRQRVTYHTSPAPSDSDSIDPAEPFSLQKRTGKRLRGGPICRSAPNLNPPASSVAVHAEIFRHPMWARTPQKDADPDPERGSERAKCVSARAAAPWKRSPRGGATGTSRNGGVRWRRNSFGSAGKACGRSAPGVDLATSWASRYRCAYSATRAVCWVRTCSFRRTSRISSDARSTWTRTTL